MHLSLVWLNVIQGLRLRICIEIRDADLLAQPLTSQFLKIHFFFKSHDLRQPMYATIIRPLSRI